MRFALASFVPIGCLLLAASGTAQSINIDVGSPTAGFGVPSNGYGAGGLAGKWNALDGTNGTVLPALLDLSGAATAASVTITGTGGNFSFNNAGTSGDDQALLDDLKDVGGAGQTATATFTGLTDGDYVVRVYAWAPDDRINLTTTVTVVGGVIGPQTLGGAWPGTQALGVTYAQDTVKVAGGGMTIRAATAAGFGSLNGIQLEFVPPPQTCLPGAIASQFVSNNGGSVGGGVYFNLNVANPAGISVESIDINTSLAAGGPVTLEVFTSPGGFLGKESMPGAWTMVSSGVGVSAGPDVATNVDVADFALAPGLWGVAYRAVDFAHRYTNGTGTNQNFFSADCDISAGKAANLIFAGTPFTPRVVNTRLHYCAEPGNGTNYCRPTKTNRGCLPHTVSSGTASATGGPGSFTVGCENVPATKNGFQILSLTGGQAVPFGAGTLCIQTPLLRLGIQNSGGSAVCDGKYSDDMGAIIAANPQLFPPGQRVFCQYLFRESSLPGGSGLSDGHRYVVGP